MSFQIFRFSKKKKNKNAFDTRNRDQDDDDDGEDNLSHSAANVNAAGDGVGVCRTMPWSEYSPCSVTCGIGISMRTRTFVEAAGRKKCPHITIGKRNPSFVVVRSNLLGQRKFVVLLQWKRKNA